MTNPAFDYLRQFKDVKPEVEDLVMKTIKKKFPNITLNQLQEVFEKGICGQYGKIYTLDPQTLLGWIYASEHSGKSKSYYEDALLDPNANMYHNSYPRSTDDWKKEINKAFTAYLGGTDNSAFHPEMFCYLRVDNKVLSDDFKKYLSDYPHSSQTDINRAYQRALSDYFHRCKKNGLTKIYFV